MNSSPQQTEIADFEGVEAVLIDYYGVQGKAWTIDEARTVQDLLGHRYGASEGQEANGVDPRLRRFLDTTNIKDRAQFLNHVAGKLGIAGPVSAKALAGFDELLEREKCCSSDFKDTVPGLEGLTAKGYPLGVLSNLWLFNVDHIFYNQDQLHKHFKALIFSFEVGHAKPDAEIYLEGARQLGLPPEKILFVDDDVENVKAARKLGMKVVLIDRWNRLKETIPGVVKIRLLTDLTDLLPSRK